MPPLVVVSWVGVSVEWVGWWR